MKQKNHLLLATVGFLSLLLGITLSTFTNLAKQPASIESRILQFQETNQNAREVYLYVGFVEFRSIDYGHGNFRGHIGLRNPFR